MLLAITALDVKLRRYHDFSRGASLGGGEMYEKIRNDVANMGRGSERSGNYVNCQDEQFYGAPSVCLDTYLSHYDDVYGGWS